MKVIFLDIDGVLNSRDCMNAYHSLWREKIGLSRDAYGQLFDERCVMWLQYIIAKTGAQIVISSTWRTGGLQRMKDMWQHRGLPGDVIDVTPMQVDERLFIQYPFCKRNENDRGYEIQQWIEDNDPRKYVILDDDCDMLSHQNFAQCDNKTGITLEVANKAIAYLNGE